MSASTTWGLTVLGCGLTLVLPELVDRVARWWRRRRPPLVHRYEWDRSRRRFRLQRALLVLWLVAALGALLGPPFASWLDRSDGDTVGALAVAMLALAVAACAVADYVRTCRARCGDATCAEAHP